MKNTVTLDEFTTAYIEAALWVSNDDSGEPLDKNYSVDDIAADTLAAIVNDCAKFQFSPEWQAVLSAEDDARTPRRQKHGCSIEGSAGHDFWLTRCGHGAGFWDGDWIEPHATALDKLSESFGDVDLYVGDDGKIYS